MVSWFYRKASTYTGHTVSNVFDQKSWGVSMTNVLDDLTSDNICFNTDSCWSQRVYFRA